MDIRVQSVRSTSGNLHIPSPPIIKIMSRVTCDVRRDCSTIHHVEVHGRTRRNADGRSFVAEINNDFARGTYVYLQYICTRIHGYFHSEIVGDILVFRRYRRRL